MLYSGSHQGAGGTVTERGVCVSLRRDMWLATSMALFLVPLFLQIAIHQPPFETEGSSGVREIPCGREKRGGTE